MEQSDDQRLQPVVFKPTLTLCNDGYVRLTLTAFSQVALLHLCSGLDDDAPEAVHAEGAQLAPISGYTEWLSHTMPTITLGWDWVLERVGSAVRCVRTGEPRSNVMLIDERGQDLGCASTAALLACSVDGLAWQEEALKAIQKKYS